MERYIQSPKTFTYNAGGEKLRTDYYINPLPNMVPQVNGGTGMNRNANLQHTRVDYCGNLVYENDTLKQALFEGGYVTFNGSSPQYHFYVQDHLGNNRVVCNASGTIEQVNHYYPYGGLMGESTNDEVQRYKYNGKELDRMHGLNLYDYGARQYDGAGVRFTSMDSKCENYYHISPYVYCMGNPVMYVDPDGRDAIICIQGNVVTISSNVYLYGSGATKSVLQQMQSDVNKIWGNNYSVEHKGTTFNVKFDINLSLYGGKEKSNPLIIPDLWNPFSRDNYIKISADCQRSFVKGGDEGQWRSEGRQGMPLSQDDPAPHEVGHLLGLPDQYTDRKGPNKGWENNIMGNSRNGEVDNRNVTDILKNVWIKYDEWLKDGNTGEYWYEINP